MGLDFSHCDAHWAYSGFKRFRCKLWNSCGFSGWLYDLYDKNLFLKQITEKHPLFDFFYHSDWDGELTPNQMKTIIPAIESIICNWPDNYYDKGQAHELIKGMRLAISKNENLIFK